MKKKISKQSGFTLIEMILYIAIVSIFISGAILFAWNIVYGRIKSQVQLDGNYNLHFLTQRTSYELKNAVSIYSLTSNDVCLQMAESSRNPTRIYLQTGAIRTAWGGGSVDCTSMTNDVQLSSDKINITNLTLTNLSQGISKNIQFTIGLEVINVSGRQEWDFSASNSSSVELKTD